MGYHELTTLCACTKGISELLNDDLPMPGETDITDLETNLTLQSKSDPYNRSNVVQIQLTTKSDLHFTLYNNWVTKLHNLPQSKKQDGNQMSTYF